MADHDINLDDFPLNSSKNKEEHRAEKVIKGEVRKAKPNFLKKAAGAIFADDISEEDIRTELIFDYLVPTIKDTLVDMGKMLLDAIFYGSMKPRSKGGSNKPVKVSYSDYYDKKSRPTSSSDRTSYNFDEYAFDSRKDAEEVLGQLIEMINTYDVARVADFCDVIGVTGNFTDNKYGWTDLTHVTISRTKDGYVINFPRPQALS